MESTIDSNKSEIVVVFDTEDTKKGKDFAASADLKERWRKLAFWTHQQSISLNQSTKHRPLIGKVTRRKVSEVAL